MSSWLKIKLFLISRLSEGSTWVGVGTLLTLAGVSWANRVDWGGLAGLGVIISGVLKILIPDKLFSPERKEDKSC